MTYEKVEFSGILHCVAYKLYVIYPERREHILISVISVSHHWNECLQDESSS